MPRLTMSEVAKEASGSKCSGEGTPRAEPREPKGIYDCSGRCRCQTWSDVFWSIFMAAICLLATVWQIVSKSTEYNFFSFWKLKCIHCSNSDRFWNVQVGFAYSVLTLRNYSQFKEPWSAGVIRGDFLAESIVSGRNSLVLFYSTECDRSSDVNAKWTEVMKTLN